MEKSNKRIYLCGLQQETDSFNLVPTTIKDYLGVDYDDPAYHQETGRIYPESISDGAVRGMLDVMERRGYEVICGVHAKARSGGAVQQDVVDWFLDHTIGEIRQAGKLDGVLVVLHGATQSAESDDVCGDILTAIRQEVGGEAVIAASCDLHANVTRRMAGAADYICGYQTYPHLDFFQVGSRAATLLADKLEGRQLKMAHVTVPVMASAHAYTTERGGLKQLMDRGHDMVARGRLADFSIFQVQPWLDVKEIGSAVLAVAEDEETAVAAAWELALGNFSLREELQGERLWTIEEVVDAARNNHRDGHPVVLSDSADSPGAGANGDSAAVLEAVLPYRDSLRVAFALDDIPAVEKAWQLGVGAVADFTLGATRAPHLSHSVVVKDAVVRSLSDGTFIHEGAAKRGEEVNIGRCAVLQAGKIKILVSTNSQLNGDLQFYRGFGIEPTLCDLVNVKRCTSFRVNYEPFAAMICNASTPGASSPDLKSLPYQRIPRPFYPFDEVTEEMIDQPVCYR